MDFRQPLTCITVTCLLAISGSCFALQAAAGAQPRRGAAAAHREPLIIVVGASRDVFKLGRAPQLAAELRKCGFDAVFRDPARQQDDPCRLAGLIRHAVVCQRRPVMLVGWSIGAVAGLRAIEIVGREGIRVDTFVELDCFFLPRHMGDGIHDHNTARSVVIRSRLNERPVSYRRAIFHRLQTMSHLSVPLQEHTRRVLMAEASRLRKLSGPARQQLPSTRVPDQWQAASPGRGQAVNRPTPGRSRDEHGQG